MYTYKYPISIQKVIFLFFDIMSLFACFVNWGNKTRGWMKQAQSGYWQRKRTGSPKAPTVSVQSLSRVWLCNSMDCTCQASLSLSISQSLPKFMFTASVVWSSHLILWHPPLLLPSIFPSIRVFSNQSALHIRWPKYWSFSFSISPSNEYSGRISFKMEWFDLLAVQGTL